MKSVFIAMSLTLSVIYCGTTPAQSAEQRGAEEQAAFDHGVRQGQDDLKAGRTGDAARHSGAYEGALRSAFEDGYRQGYRSIFGGLAEKGKGSNNENSAYQSGYRYGEEDYHNERGRDWRRHEAMVDPPWRAAFRRGYEEGYDQLLARNGGMTPTEKRYYEEGFRRGKQDKRDKLNRDYKRHQNLYASRYESFFRRGYDDGYGKDEGGLSPERQQAYDLGRQLGRGDAQARLSNDYTRYRARYTRATERDFRTGYQEGYDSLYGDARQQQAFREGRRLGVEDSRAGFSRDYTRHHRRYDRHTEAAFRDGYLQGYRVRNLKGNVGPPRR